MSSPITFSGLASGIDSSALITSLISTERKVRISPLENKITELTDTSTSLKKIQELLTTLKEKGDVFRALSGGVLAKDVVSSDETVAIADAANGSTHGTYALTVTQLARSGTSSFNDRFSTDDAVINSSINDSASSTDRTVQITVGEGSEAEEVNVVLSSSTTASQFVAQFNEASTAASASLVNVGTTSAPSYAIVISSLHEGEAEGKLTVSVGNEILTAGSGALSASTTTQAQDALFSLSGISGSITRSTNTVNDVISGVTLSLRSAGSTTITVSNDATTSAQSVQEFVDAYNEVLSYIKEHDAITQEEGKEGTTNIFGPLSKTSIDENILSSLRSAFSQSSVTGGTISTLADLGITTQRDGSLAFDQDTFTEAVTNDPLSTENILGNLGETLSSVDGTISQFTRFGGLIDGELRRNDSGIQDYRNRITELEKRLDQQEAGLTARYARLESLIAKFTSQQTALSSLST